MRFLVGLIGVLLASWSAYWLVGERVIETRVAGFLAHGSPAGLLVSQTDVTVSGFPNRFDLTVTEPSVLELTTGWGWSADFAQVFAMTWKPWHLIAALPNRQNLQTPFGPVTLESSKFRASLMVAPSSDLAFEQAVLEVDDAKLIGTAVASMQADLLILAARREPDTGFAYRLGLQIEDLSAILAGAEAIQNARLDGVVVTTGPLDRNFAAVSPEVIEIRLNAVSVNRGSVSINGTGRIAPLPNGLADGQLNFKISGWADLPRMLADFGLIDPAITETVGNGLRLIAKEQGEPDVLDLPLVYKDGKSYLGPFPLGRAPMLVYRQ